LSGRLVVSSPKNLGSERRVAAETALRLYGLSSVELELEEDPAKSYINTLRGQVEALRLVETLSKDTEPHVLRLHVTGLDIYFNDYYFCFGLAFKNAAVVSIFRLRDSQLGKFLSRLRKEVGHEIGHLLGLKHCTNPRCVMFFSNSILDTDFKGEEPCPKCRLQLARSGER